MLIRLKTGKARLCTKVDLRFFAPASPPDVRQGYDVNLRSVMEIGSPPDP